MQHIPYAPARQLVRRVPRSLIAGLLLAACAIAPVTAAPPSSGSTVRVDDAVYGATTTAYAGPAAATWVRARCYQGGNLVYEQFRAFDSTRTATLTMGPTPSWGGGAASCTADDGYWRRSSWRTTSSTTFSVAA